jgi:hypothetical protein
MIGQFGLRFRLPRKSQGSLTCRKSATWDRRFYFPSEGRYVVDFFSSWKIRRLRPGSNPWFWIPEASMLNTKPPKPLSHTKLTKVDKTWWANCAVPENIQFRSVSRAVFYTVTRCMAPFTVICTDPAREPAYSKYCSPLPVTLWRRSFSFFNFCTPVFKMWIIHEANEVELWTKRHFEEKRTGIMQHV